MLRRARAGQGHGRRGRAGLDELPVLPDLHRPGLRVATTPSSRWPWSGPTTTGTSTSGAAPTPAGSSRWRSRSSGTPSRPPTRSGGRPPRAVTRSASPRTRPRSATRASTTSTGTRCGGRAATPGTVLSIHLGSSGRLSIPAVDSPPDVMITLQPMNIQSAAADLLWSRVLKNFPDLRVALSEGGTGWIPYFLERVDRTYEMHRAWTLQDFGGRLPERGVPGALPDLLHQRPGGHRSCATGSASTTSPGRPTTRTATRCGRPRPRSSHARLHRVRRPRRRHRQDDPRERHALVLLRPLRPHARGGGDGGCAPSAGRRSRRVGHVPEHPGPHAGREARGFPFPGPTGRGRSGETVIAGRGRTTARFRRIRCCTSTRHTSRRGATHFEE